MEIKPELTGNNKEKLSLEEKLTNQILREIDAAKDDEAKKKLAAKLAEQIVDYQKLARLNEKMATVNQEIADTDELTGLPNRRYFQKTLEREIKNNDRYQQPLSLLVADVDKMKNLNDLDKSHLIGDKALKEIAGAIKNGVRDSDFPARWGGDEFVVILPRSDKEGSLKVAKRILENVKNLDPVSGINLSISIGIAERQGNENEDQFFKKADAAAYQAKNLKQELIIADD